MPREEGMAVVRHHSRAAARRSSTARENGFTLIELLVVILILGILITIAVPSYLGFKARAQDATAKSNLRSAVPAVEDYAVDNVGAKGDADGKKGTTGYKGMTATILQASYDAGLSPNLTVVSGKTNATKYCLTDTEGAQTWSLLGPPPLTFHNNAKCK
jgi:prepilin-type N-terminal cleavage/methylation domain-containing protein